MYSIWSFSRLSTPSSNTLNSNANKLKVHNSRNPTWLSSFQCLFACRLFFLFYFAYEISVKLIWPGHSIQNKSNCHTELQNIVSKICLKANRMIPLYVKSIFRFAPTSHTFNMFVGFFADALFSVYVFVLQCNHRNAKH